MKKLVNAYDKRSNLLSCVTYDADNQFAFEEKKSYNRIGQVISHIDRTGKEIQYGYNNLGEQISIAILQDNRVINTVYNLCHQPIQVTEINGENERVTHNTFDILGRKTASTDCFGNITEYEYDAFHRLTKIIHPEVIDENRALIRPTFSYTYDIFGNALTVEDPKGYVTQKSYNLYGSPTKIVYPDSSFELFSYSSGGSLCSSTTREQITTVYKYDYLDRPIYQENFALGETPVTSRVCQYNGFRCTYEKEGNLTKRYGYDSVGRLASLVEYATDSNEYGPESRLIEFTYDSLGRLHRQKVWFDTGAKDYSLECWEYDLLGNVNEKRIEDAQGSILMRKGFIYDAQGHCIEEFALKNGIKTSVIKNDYNDKGEPISHHDALEHESTVIIDRFYHNLLGQIVTKQTLTNAIGVQTEIEYDALSRVYSISKKDPSGILLSHQNIFYDALGNKSCEIHDQIVDGQTIDTQTFRWIYGPMGRLEEVVEAANTSLEKRTRYSYNSLGKMICKTSSSHGGSIAYRYDKKGKLHKVEAKNSKKELQISNSYYYDRKGNITSAESCNGISIQKTYNAFNEVISERIQDGLGSYTLHYLYDRKGRLKEVILPDGSKIAYAYDAAFGRAVKRISPQGEILYTHTYDHYDSEGNLLQESHIGSVGLAEYAYDLNGNKISAKNDFFIEQYGRDVLNRLSQIASDQQQQTQYSYNFLSQLVSEKKDAEKTYFYDSLDNCIQSNNQKLSYNALNQLTSNSNNSKAEFSYDPDGNLLKKVLDGEETRFESNLLSQLISIEKADKTKLIFSYDPFGRALVEKQIKGKATLATARFLYLGHQEIGTLSDTKKIATLKIPGLRGNELAHTCIAFELEGAIYAPMHDISGNVKSLINPSSCQIIESYQYTAFGEERIYDACGNFQEQSQVGNPWRFAEKRIDQESRLIYFGLRFYDPSIGRWISQDPAGFIDGRNLYAYLHNNPINHFDRFGLETESNSQNASNGTVFLTEEQQEHISKAGLVIGIQLFYKYACQNYLDSRKNNLPPAPNDPNLPKIRYLDAFEEIHRDYRTDTNVIPNFFPDSTTYDLRADGLTNLPGGLGIGFINGVWNNFADSKASAEYLSKMADGCNIHGVYNATHGGSGDYHECILNLKYIATEPVRQLHKMWNNHFQQNFNTNFLMICHSQGAIHVRNALLDYPQELRNQILVVAIAPAAYIYKETCAQVIHYRAEWWKDFIPRLDWFGARREKDSIIDLTSDPRASIFDHNFMSPTYAIKLQDHISNYITSKGEEL